MWADWLYHPCRLVFPQQGTEVRGGLYWSVFGYMTLAIWGVRNNGAKSKVAHI